MEDLKQLFKNKMGKFVTCLWFDNEAEEAANLYCSVFPNSKILKVTKYTTDTPSNKPIGSVLTVRFSLDGNEFLALNGGTDFKVTEAVSFIIPCKNQEEIDYYYDKLSAFKESEICGWLKDKFGVSWQLATNDLDKLIEKKEVMDELLKMKRLDIEKLRRVAKE